MKLTLGVSKVFKYQSHVNDRSVDLRNYTFRSSPLSFKLTFTCKSNLIAYYLYLNNHFKRPGDFVQNTIMFIYNWTLKATLSLLSMLYEQETTSS